jgi:hypothetical protein
VRRPESLDLLFGRILDERTPESELLADVELLVYFGQYEKKGDERISSEKADAVLIAIDVGRLSAAEAKYPEAPIKSQLLRAVCKSQNNAKMATTKPAAP